MDSASEEDTGCCWAIIFRQELGGIRARIWEPEWWVLVRTKEHALSYESRANGGRIELSKTNGTKLVLSYGKFRVDGPNTSYTLHVSDKQYEGFDFVRRHNGYKFSTLDRDNDEYNSSCSIQFNGGGNWFSNCFDIYLTDMPKPQLHYESSDFYDYAELRVRPKGCIASQWVRKKEGDLRITILELYICTYLYIDGNMIDD